GSETSVSVNVKDSTGAPAANTEVALVVVDESVLALSNYSIADPLGAFYTSQWAGVSDFHSRKDVVLGNQGDLSFGSMLSEDNVVNAQQSELLPKGKNFTSVLRVAAGVLPAPKAGG